MPMTDRPQEKPQEPAEEVIQLNVNGVIKDAVEVLVEQKNDPWIVANLSDGTEVRMRITLMRAYRILKENNPMSGEPAYHFEPNVQFSIRSPARLRKLPQPKKPDNREIT